jgi:hypothetical protein
MKRRFDSCPASSISSLLSEPLRSALTSRASATKTASGRLVERAGSKSTTAFYEVYTLREGKVLRIDEYEHRADALEAAGLRE